MRRVLTSPWGDPVRLTLTENVKEDRYLESWVVAGMSDGTGSTTTAADANGLGLRHALILSHVTSHE